MIVIDIQTGATKCLNWPVCIITSETEGVAQFIPDEISYIMQKYLSLNGI